MQKYMDNENLLPKEQKGCSSGTKGCKDKLLISKAILRECKSRKRMRFFTTYGIVSCKDGYANS